MKVYELTIAKEPYLFFRVEKSLTIYPKISGTKRPIVVNKGDFIMIDRWFNLGTANEQQMSQLIKSDYENRKKVKANK
jgi:hypothetical protein